jgi:hypothetical protein
MEKILKQFIRRITKFLMNRWTIYQNWKLYKKMVSGVKLRKLTKEQERLAQNYYKEKIGQKINLKWHKYYYTVNNMFTHKYIPLELYYTKVVSTLNDRTLSKAYADKNVTNYLFPHVLQPITILKNMNGFYYIDEKQISKNEAITTCSNLADAVIKQAMDSAQGKSIIRFSSSKGITSHNSMSIEKLLELYGKNFIVQRAVTQHPIFASLNSTSLNTVRLTTYRREEDVVVLSSLVRMGKKGSKIDNVSAGGLFCGINQDGFLSKYAYSLKPTRSYDKNELNIEFNKIAIPSYSQIIEKAKLMHLSLPYTKIVGWDFTVNNNNEVVLIELNLHSPGVYQLTGPALGNYTDEILEMISRK